jgi:hypothetical protein
LWELAPIDKGTSSDRKVDEEPMLVGVIVCQRRRHSKSRIPGAIFLAFLTFL